jgi:hypothetical protein
MVLSILFIFSLIVIIIGLATAKLNAKGPCAHQWVETEDGHIKCTKCYRMIRHIQDIPEPELSVAPLARQDDSAPVRPEGIKISVQVVERKSANQ